MNDTTTIPERVSRVEAFQKSLFKDVDAINAKLDMLLDRSNQQIGERRMMRLLIGALAAIMGLVGGWVSHFWWQHP